MKVILLADVKKQGKKGDVIEVKDGYGTFLINSKQAIVASQGSLGRLHRENEQKEQELSNDLKEAEKTKTKIEKVELSFAVKTGEGDKVFGSVSPKQIAEQLKEKGYDVDKKQIKVQESLSTLGYHNVDIELHKKVVATVKVALTK